MAFQEDFAQAMGQAGYPIDAGSVPDASTLQSGISSAQQWYDGLDPVTKQAIDAATKDPGQAATALTEAGVTTGIDPLLQAFDQVTGSLGDLLRAAEQAWQTAQQSNP